MDLELAGKIALVTGASAGIGRGIATVLAAEGAQTVIVARRAELLATLQDEIAKAGGKRPLAITADLCDRATPGKVRDEVLQQFGRLDILVNNAGAGMGGKKLSLDAEDEAWDRAFALNFTAPRKMAQAFLASMQERKWGRIINITGNMEPENVSAQGPAKAGVAMWAKGLAKSVGKHGITVNCVVPGTIHSEQMDKKKFPTPESQARYVEVHVPVGFFGEPYDIGNMVAFLCSPRARYVTGQRIHVDGGRHRGV